MTVIVSIGIVVLDDIYAIPDALRPGEKHRAGSLQSVIGGNAANASLAIARLGGNARLITRFGDDETGRILRRQLEAEGLDLVGSAVVRGTQSSRSAIVIEPDGSRTIINHFDPKMPELPDWLPQSLPAEVAAVLGDTRWEGGAKHLFRLARAQGTPAIFDGDRKPADENLIALATHPVFSAQGLREWSGENDLSGGLRRLAAKASGFAAVTDGASGVFYKAGEVLGHVPAFPVRAIDTLGAGDVWHGAFALALGEGKEPVQAIRFANAAAAIKCSRPGGASGSPGREEVEAFLATTSSP